jgi:hypothetical protein
MYLVKFNPFTSIPYFSTAHQSVIKNIKVALSFLQSYFSYGHATHAKSSMPESSEFVSCLITFHFSYMLFLLYKRASVVHHIPEKHSLPNVGSAQLQCEGAVSHCRSKETGTILARALHASLLVL